MFVAKLFPEMTIARYVSTLMLALLLPVAATAQGFDLDQIPWSIFSETASYDGKTKTTTYTGLKFSQGNISIESDFGTASTASEKDRSLKFSGNVVIEVNDGRIECDSADLRFDGSVLKYALVSGKPASFEIQRSGADDATYAEAGKLKYDVQGGIIEFSENATITESGNEISSNFLVYNITDRRINADSSGAADDRVRITFTPTRSDSDDATSAQEKDENP